MKCDLCATESDFDAAFVKEHRSFRFSQRTVCLECWVRRNRRWEIGNLILIGLVGATGFLLDWIVPGSFIGTLFRNVFLITLFLILSIIPHELGHAIVARAVGWRVYQMVIG